MGNGRRPHRACVRAALCASVVAVVSPLVAPGLSGAQAESLGAVLGRATEYVDDLHERLTNVVMEERYEQSATMPASAGFGGRAGFDRVTLRSDYLLVRPEGSYRHFGFRDVFEVDGSTVQDRAERLRGLFLDPSATVRDRIQGILTDSSRYNVGDIERNTNTPTLALLFLHSSFKTRFDFERLSDGEDPELGVDLPDDAGDVWVVAYRETWPTTVIQQRRGGNVPSRGRYFIEAATGRVLVTELSFDDPNLESLIVVRYAMDETIGHPVPVEMRERYANRQSGSRVTGTAEYSEFRRFQVVVEESDVFRN
ncbi:MAG: hypothetical protein F4Z04_16465 [Acidobacteria bacterium]|nr:hypothetical protein [Acidobacteriota bacterium]